MYEGVYRTISIFHMTTGKGTETHFFLKCACLYIICINLFSSAHPVFWKQIKWHAGQHNNGNIEIRSIQKQRSSWKIDEPNVRPNSKFEIKVNWRIFFMKKVQCVSFLMKSSHLVITKLLRHFFSNLKFHMNLNK